MLLHKPVTDPVGDGQQGQLLHLQKFPFDLIGGCHIDSGHPLVQNQHLHTSDQSPGQRDALTLPPER